MTTNQREVSQSPPTTSTALATTSTPSTPDAAAPSPVVDTEIVEDRTLMVGGLAARTPADVVRVGTEVATSLGDVIERQGLYATIRGRRYVTAEGWGTCVAMLGLTTREVAVEEREGGEYVATCELVRVADGSVVGRASASCGAEDDGPWPKRPRHARRSMAVTRAGAKAARLSLAWIVTLAGYAGTPAEELDPDSDGGRVGSTTADSSRASSPPSRQDAPGAREAALALLRRWKGEEIDERDVRRALLFLIQVEPRVGVPLDDAAWTLLADEVRKRLDTRIAWATVMARAVDH